MESSNPQESDLDAETEATDELEVGISRKKEELMLCETNDLWSGSNPRPPKSDVDPNGRVGAPSFDKRVPPCGKIKPLPDDVGCCAVGSCC